MSKSKQGFDLFGLWLFMKFAGICAALGVLLTLTAACSSDASDFAAGAADGAGGAKSKSPASEPGGPGGQMASVAEGDQTAASVRAFVASQTARPPSELTALGAGAGAAPAEQEASGSSAPEFRPLNKVLDLSVPPSTPTAYPLSADGKYYTVNLLHRNFLPPTSSATFSSGVHQLGAAGPPLVYDGGDLAFSAVTDTPGDPNVTVTLIVDMGQYFSVGAVRPMYAPMGGGYPLRQRIRLATKLGPNADWRTPVEESPVPTTDTTLSFDNTPGRFLELTMVGNGCNLDELFVYPSAQTSPPPTSANGYDLTSIGSTSTVNENYFPLGLYWPVSWPAGGFYPKTMPWGPTGDAVALVDLGGQYPVSRLQLNFFWSSPWENGGRLEIASTPDAYSTLAESELGHVFFPWPHTLNFPVSPQQSVRYIRTTDFFTPGVGPSGQTLWAVHAFGDPGQHVGYFPLSADGKYFDVNLMRRPASETQPTASVSYSNGAFETPSNPNNVIDGDDADFSFRIPTDNMPEATATITVDLGQVQTLGAIRQLYGNSPPASSSIRVASTSAGPWQVVVPSTGITTSDLTSSFAPTAARFIELTMRGTSPGHNFANLLELMAYPSSAIEPGPSSGSRLDLTYLTGMVYTPNSNLVFNAGSALHGFDGYVSLKNASQGATGDGTLTVDLGQPFQLSEVQLGFYANQTWQAGGKLEIDDGSGGWTTVYDSGRGTALGAAAGGMQKIVFATHTSRYLRLTSYFDPAAAQGLLRGIAVFGDNVPCTPSCVGKTCGSDGCGGLCGQLCSGLGCVTSADCQLGLVCTGFAPGGTTANVCQVPGYASTCTNGVRDGNETDVDCGGSCGPCAPGLECAGDADCRTNLVCGHNNGAYFDKARGKKLCWAPTCPSVGGCGEANSPCGNNCTGVVTCDAASTTSTCPAGEVCRSGISQVFGANSKDVCVDQACPSNDPALCGSPSSLCGTSCVCTPNCSAATCQNPGDGCGGICPGVCQNGDAGCRDDIACGAGFSCIASADGVSSCRPAACAFRILAPPLCGHPGAQCGDQCPACAPSCDGRQCGVDPRCGQSCGSCGAGTFCDISGQCVAESLSRVLQVPDGHGGTRPLPPLPPPLVSETAPVGAVAGQFSVSEQGSPVYSIPIEVPPGRAGMEPALSLQYSGSRANGEVGVGWHLEGLSKITRCPRSYALDGVTGPVRNDPTDRFCIDGKRLEAIPGSSPYGSDGAEYRTLIDSFAKVVSHAGQAGIQPDPLGNVVPVPRTEQGPDSFEVWTKDGRKLSYGGTYDATVIAHTGIRYAWLLNRVEDRAGNTMVVSYSNLAMAAPESQTVAPNSVVLPSAIAYTGHTGSQEIVGKRQVQFEYEARTDPQLRFTQGGSPFVAAQRLSRITTFVGTKPVKNYHLQYAGGQLSQVEKIFECVGADDSRCKPPTKFEYSHVQGFAHDDVEHDLAAAGQLDMNGDGLPDFMETNILVDGVPAQPTLKAAQVVADIVVTGAALAVDAYVGPEAGYAVSLTWDVIKMPFWGLFAKEPTITFQHSLRMATGKSGGSTFASIPDVKGLRCGSSEDHPAFMLDYDQDGRDDILSACRDNGSLFVAHSLGDGNFESLPKDNSPVATFTTGLLSTPDDELDAQSARLPGPILIDVDGDGLQDIVSCPDQYTIEVRRRLAPPAAFETVAIRFATELPPPPPEGDYSSPPRARQKLCGHTRPTYNIVDLDGDGTPDLLTYSEDGWYALRLSVSDDGKPPTLSWRAVAMPNTGGSETGKNLNLGDFNGDGLPDVFGYDDKNYTVWLNTGGGRFMSRPIARPKPSLPDSPAKFGFKRIAVIDYDSDGRDDFLEHWQTPTYYVGNGSYQSDSFNWALKPDGQLNLFSTDTVDSIRWLNPDIHRLVPADFTMSADIDGDGHPDLFGGNTSVFYGSGDVSLSRITDGLGKAVDIHYGTSALGGGYQPDARCAADNAPGSSWPEKCLPRMSGIVAGHTEGTIDASGSLVPERTYTYTYVNGRMNLTGHGWLGFDRKIISAVSSAPGDPGTTTTIDYEPVVRYTPGGQVSTHVDKPYLYPFAGLPKITTVDQHVSSTGASNPPLQNGFYERRTQTVNHWGVQQSAFNRPFPVVTSRTTSTYDRPIPGGIGGPPPPFEFNGTLLTSCDTSLSTDNYGNLWYEDRKCSVGTVYVEEFRTTKTFIPDLSAWLISNPENITISNIGTLGAEREYHLTYSQGLLDTVTRAPNELGDQWHKSTYVRDGVGNVWQVIEETLTDPSRTTTISYDDDGLFPSTVTNAAGQTTQISFDANWGVPDGIVDPNGIAVQFAHDGFGRLTKRQGPDGATLSTYSAIAAPDPTTAAGSIDPKIQVRVDRTGADGSRDGAILTEYDGYGRPVRTTSEGLAGAQVIQERVYDQLGRVSGNTLPHTPNSSPEQPTVPFDHYTYDDPLKRVTRVDHSDGSFKQYQYASWASIATAYYPWFNGLLCAGEQTSGCVVDITRTIDEELRENVVFADYTGKVIRNIDGENTADTAHTSNYVYGPFDQLLEAHDNRNLATKFDHDDYGRLLVQTDPDTGASVFTYNGFDELRTSKDPKQQLRTYNHDSLGRIESIVDPDGLTQWIYDQGPNALGRLSESISPATQENPSGQDIRYSYEPATETANRGFLQSVTYTIDGAPYSVSLDYDDLGRTSRIHYPSAGSGPPIVAQYKYDNSGVLYGLDEVGSGTPHSLWNVIDVFQGHLIQNETLGNGSSATHTTYGYNSDRHWLENVQTTLGAEQIQSLNYTHYANGLVHTLEAKGSDPREYIYDKLNRLAFEITSPAQSAPVSTPYTYDDLGNLVGRGSNINSYRPTQPHLLQFAGNNAYDYDANGNVATRTGPGIPGGQQNIAYTAFDLPRTISTPNSNELLDNVHFDYSADEERLTRRDPDGTTRHFVADLYQRKFDSFGTTQEERFRLYAGDRQIAEITRKDSADQTLYFHPDHLGSPETISDNNGAAYHQHFDPFGARVEPTSPELTRIGFTGQE